MLVRPFAGRCAYARQMTGGWTKAMGESGWPVDGVGQSVHAYGGQAASGSNNRQFSGDPPTRGGGQLAGTGPCREPCGRQASRIGERL